MGRVSAQRSVILVVTESATAPGVTHLTLGRG